MRPDFSHAAFPDFLQYLYIQAYRVRFAEYLCIIYILIVFTGKTNTNSARKCPSQHK